MDRKEKNAIMEAYAEWCPHRMPTYNGDAFICELKEKKENCINRDQFNMLLSCPRGCPHFPKREKVLCTPKKCGVTQQFIANISLKINY